jgi:Protein of unknown function (DUF3105)
VTGKRAGARDVVTAPTRPWGLIAAAVAVLVFAVAVITWAVTRDDGPDTPEDIEGVRGYDYAAGQHTADAVPYEESPPVGGMHDVEWADCTGSVYDVDIRHENAVHSLEHGAVWITYDPDRAGADDVEALAAIVEGAPGLMLSPYDGLDGVVSLQAWNHQLFVDSASDPRIQQFVDLMAMNADYAPEVGAPCENPGFLADPRVAARA